MKNWKSASISIVLLAVLLNAAVFLPVNAAEKWNFEIIDEHGGSWDIQHCPVVLDSKNLPHIIYTELHLTWRQDKSYTVNYAYWDGFGWNKQTLGEGIAYSIAIDANDNLHIVYGSIDQQGQLTYANKTGNNWIYQTVYSYDPGYTSIAVDSWGKPHIAFSSGGELKYASWTGSDWSIQKVDDTPANEYSLSLALDSNNNPTIAYYFTLTVLNVPTGVYTTTSSLRLATFKDSNWEIQNLSDMPGELGNIVLDSNENPHLTYKLSYPPKLSAFDNSTLVYASWDGASWNMQSVITNDYVDSMNLDLDSQDNPHIIFSSGVNLTYTSLTSNGWEKQTFNSTLGPCCLALDSNNLPHLTCITPNLNSDNVYYVNVAYATVPEASNPLGLTLQNWFLPLTLTAVLVAVGTTLALVWKKKKH